MKNIKLSRIVIYVLLIMVAISCQDDDFGNIEKMKVYVPAIGPSYNSINGNVVVLRNEILPGNDLKFPVLSTRPVPKDVQVTAIIDTTLISVYDSIYGKQSPQIPDGLFVLDNNIVTINAGQTSSKDSVSFVVDAQKQAGASSFVVPIVISTVNTPVPTSTTRDVMYVNVAFTEVVSYVGETRTNRIITSSIDYTPVNVIGPDKLIFSGFLSQAIPKPADITISVAENSEIDAYNQKHGTNYRYFPAGAYSLSKNTVTVPVDATVSQDNFEVTISNLNAFEKDSSYLLALSIKDEGVVNANVDANTMYLILNAGFSNIDMSKTSAPETILNRSEWIIDDFGSESFGPVVSVLDDNYNTSWLTMGTECYVTIDMGIKQSLNGLQLSPNYKYNVSYNTPVFEIATSEDNNTWTMQGTYSGITFGGSVDDPDLRNVHFYEPVEAQYFRITFKGGSFAGASEIRGF